MSESMEIKLTGRKIDRKRKKCQHIIERETGISCTDTPTKNLIICNAGLVNGLSEATVVENFIKYGSIEQVIMIPGKSCCIIMYMDVSSSIIAYNSCSGVLNIAQNNRPIILSYCSNVPLKYLNQTVEEQPSGFLIVNDFVNETEETLLLSLCRFEDGQCSSNLKFRKVEHYGYEFCYDINNVNKNEPLEKAIPDECSFLWSRLRKITDIEFIPDQLTVNCYNPGQGIPTHVDTHSAFEDPIISLSLGSSIVMEFKHTDGRHSSILLPQRSMLIMSGESRYDWKHGITPRHLDVFKIDGKLSVLHRKQRTSFTFRKIRRGICNCSFQNNCDTQMNQENEITDKLALQLETTHVYKVYENIATHFSETRHKPWPNVLHFIQSLNVGNVLVDVGCGNGKYLGHRQDIIQIGCDTSSNLLTVCKRRGFNVFNCNCLHIPLKGEIADAAISIAVIHHLANEVRRLDAVKEIVRILNVNGKALIYVWAKDQNKDNKKTTYLKQDRKNRRSVTYCKAEKNSNVPNDFSLPVHTNRSQFKHKDVLVPWKLKPKDNENDQVDMATYLRFYHVFEEHELANLCKKIPNIRIIDSYYDEGNWCILFEKMSKEIIN